MYVTVERIDAHVSVCHDRLLREQEWKCERHVLDYINTHWDEAVSSEVMITLATIQCAPARIEVDKLGTLADTAEPVQCGLWRRPLWRVWYEQN